MARHRPDLAEKMQNGFVDRENPYALGFIAGAKEHEKEVSRPRTRDYAPNHLPKSPKDPKKDRHFLSGYLAVVSSYQINRPFFCTLPPPLRGTGKI